MRYIGIFLVGLLPLATACAANDEAAADTRLQEGRVWQGRVWQGRVWQGRVWQGRVFQGTDAAASTIEAVRLDNAVVEGLTLNGSELQGSLPGRTLRGADFVGATVVQRDLDGSQFESTITAVQPDPQDPEIQLFTVTVKNPSTGEEESFCDPDPWGGQYATIVAGRWNWNGDHVNVDSERMFACTSGVVAKCARWGYKPWKTVSGRSLLPYHQACTRMARADYCGDGVTHTEDGTAIDVYDDLGIQIRSPFSLTSPMLFDAAWTTQGAYCMTKDRWLKLSTLASVTLDCKTRFLNLFPLLETSPVDSRDLCAVKRSDVARSEAHIDNQSGININLQ